jgi:hypothetical protein
MDKARTPLILSICLYFSSRYLSEVSGVCLGDTKIQFPFRGRDFYLLRYFQRGSAAAQSPVRFVLGALSSESEAVRTSLTCLILCKAYVTTLSVAQVIGL